MHLRLLPAERFAVSETARPISFAVSVNNLCPCLTSSPKGSSPIPVPSEN